MRMLLIVGLLVLASMLSIASPPAAPAEEERAAEPGNVKRSELEALHRKLFAELPPAVGSRLRRDHPQALLVARCAGHFSKKAGAPEHAFTLLRRDPAGASGEGTGRLHIVRTVLLADGRGFRLDWTRGPTFSVTDEPDSVGQADNVYIGELSCLRPGEIQAFLGRFLPGFRRPEASSVDLAATDSVCFSFDAVYNNWQCFSYSSGRGAFVRWGYQATAD